MGLVSRPVALPEPPTPDALVVVTDCADQTRLLARTLAPLCLPGDVVLLVGDLGAGKTTFAQGFGSALGITEPITSPTFVLVRQYPVEQSPVEQSPVKQHPVDDRAPVRVLVHADVYRLDRLHEIVELGLGELVEDGGVALVEWGDVAAPVLGSGALAVRLDVGDDDDSRVVTISPVDDAWSGRWEELVEALRPWRAVP